MWNSIQTNQLVYHVMNQTTRRSLSENSDMAEDGSLYFAYKLASTFTELLFRILKYGYLVDPRRFTHMANCQSEDSYRFFHHR